MIKQIVNGSVQRTVNANMSNADFMVLAGVLAGKAEEWTMASEGGTTANGVKINSLKVAVGKKGLTSRRSVGIIFPHIKNTRTFSEVQAAVVGSWDEDFASSVKCEYCNAFGASSKGI
jgi:hypothetical protein